MSTRQSQQAADAAYAAQMAKRATRAAHIEREREGDPTWNGAGKTQAWSASAKKRAAIRNKDRKGSGRAKTQTKGGDVWARKQRSGGRGAFKPGSGRYS